jgi:hypothetical protein
MTQNIVNVGQTPNDRSADTIRTAFQKINANFSELYALTGVSNLTELAQDYAAAMFVNGTHEGISVVYDDENNKLNLIVAQDFDGGAASTVYDDDITIDGGGA